MNDFVHPSATTPLVRRVEVRSIQGLFGLPAATVELLKRNRESQGTRVWLTTEREPFVLLLERRQAIDVTFTTALAGQHLGDTPRERHEAALAIVRERPPAWSEVLLIAEVATAVQAPPIDQWVDHGDFGVGLQLADEKALTEVSEQAVRLAMAGLALSFADQVEIMTRPLGAVTYIDDAASKPIFTVTPRASFSGHSSIALTSDAAIQAATFAALLTKDQKLRRVSDLLAESLDASKDHLRSFLAAWTGLEILVNTTFNGYEARLIKQLSSNAPPTTAGFLDRLQAVMKDKYRLNDKFAVLASLIDTAAAVSIQRFDEIKKKRDAFLHRQEGEPADLPAEATRNLLRRYLMLHLQASAGGSIIAVLREDKAKPLLRENGPSLTSAL